LIAARLALSPGRAESIDHAGVGGSFCDSGDKVRDFFRRNSFPLLGLPESLPLFQLPELVRARAEESEHYGRLRAEFEIVRQAWKAEGIEGLMLKSAGAPPDFPYGSGNLDVLVPAGWGPSARRVLSRLGFVELRHCEEPNKFLFRRFRSGTAACDVHLHLRIEWRVSFLFEDRVWDRRRRSKDEPSLLIPSPEDALLINLAHSFFENKSFSLYDLKKVDRCLSGAGLDWRYIWEVAGRKGWSSGLAVALLIHDHLVRRLVGESAVPSGESEKARRQLGQITRIHLRRLLSESCPLPFPTGFIFSKSLFFLKILADPSESNRDRLRDLFLHLTTGTKLKLGIQSQPGFLIAISGVDGAGKTTQARYLCRALERCAIRTRYVWSRPGSSLLSRRAIQLAEFIIGGLRHPPNDTNRQDSNDSNGHPQKQSCFNPGNRLHRAFWLGLVLLDCTYSFAVKVRFNLLTGHVVICDRYLPDAFADLASRFRDEGTANRLLLRLIAGICPKPDYPVLLDVEPNQAGFSPHHPGSGAAESESERSEARTLEAFARRNRHTSIEASRDPELVSDQLVFHSLSRYFASYRTFLNMVFFANPPSRKSGWEPPSTLPGRPLPMPYAGSKSEGSP